MMIYTWNRKNKKRKKVFSRTHKETLIEEIEREARTLLHATKMEQKVYSFLKNKGITFKYQKFFYPYQVDFFFPKINTVLEVDGYTHLSPEAKEKDKKRTDNLSLYDLEVIRINKVNDITLEETYQVLKEKELLNLPLKTVYD